MDVVQKPDTFEAHCKGATTSFYYFITYFLGLRGSKNKDKFNALGIEKLDVEMTCKRTCPEKVYMKINDENKGINQYEFLLCLHTKIIFSNRDKKKSGLSK